MPQWIPGIGWSDTQTGSSIDPLSGLRVPNNLRAAQGFANASEGNLGSILPASVQGPVFPGQAARAGITSSAVLNPNTLAGAGGPAAAAANAAPRAAAAAQSLGTAGAGAADLGLLSDLEALAVQGGPNAALAAAALRKSPAAATNAVTNATKAATRGGLRSALAEGAGPLRLFGTELTGLKAAGLRAAPGLAAAELLPKAINAWAPGSTDTKDIIGNTIAGAGLGATGFAVNPVVGVGTTALGAAAGFLKGMFEPEGEPELSTDDFRNNIRAGANRLGLSNPDSYVDQFNLYKDLKVPNKDGKEMSEKEIAQGVGNLMLSDYTTQKAAAEDQARLEKQTNVNAAAILSLQSQAASIFGPYANNMVATGMAEAQNLNALADQAPAAYQQLFRNQASSALNQASQLGNAYMLQASISPATQLAQQNIDQADQAQQQQIRLLQAMKAVGTGGGTGTQSFQDYVTNQGATGAGAVTGAG